MLDPIDAVLTQAAGRFGPEDGAMLARAAADARELHAGHARMDGSPFAAHVAAVAGTLADWGAPARVIAAGLLHDSLSQTYCRRPDREALARSHPSELVALVEQVARLGRFGDRMLAQGADAAELGHQRRAAATFELRRNPEAVIIKIADRLHNLESLQVLPEDRRLNFLEGVSTIFMPMAEMLGMRATAATLADRCLAWRDPEAWHHASGLASSLPFDALSRRWSDAIVPALARAGVAARMELDRISPSAIHRCRIESGGEDPKPGEILTLVLITGSEADCYRALGPVHACWRPLGTIEDRIAYPAAGFRTLETLVSERELGLLRVQICSEDMRLVNRSGYTASWQVEAERRSAIEALLPRIDPLPARRPGHIRVLTPNGDIRILPEGATPIDFAYAIHSELGDRCMRALLNGRRVDLDTRLSDGDIVKIVASHTVPGPDAAWLDFVVTERARRQILRSGQRALSAELLVEARDRIGLFGDLAAKISNLGVNIAYYHADSLVDGKASIVIGIAQTHEAELRTLRAVLQRDPHVLSVLRRAVSAPSTAHPRGVSALRPGGNPYPLNAVSGFEFKGRSREIRRVVERLRGRDQDTPILIWGQKRIGKTSLLLRLDRHVLGIEGFIPVMVSMHEVWERPILFFLHRIMLDIQRKVGIEGLAAPRPGRMARDPLYYFQRFMDRLDEILGEQVVVIMVDEFQLLGGLKEEGATRHEVFTYLRSLAQHGTSVSLLFSGGGLPSRLRAESGLAEFMAAADHLHMGYLSEAAARAVITEIAPGMDYAESAIDRILAETRCHPYYLQFLCREIYEQAEEREYRVDEGLVDAVIEAALAWDQKLYEAVKYLWIIDFEDRAATARNHLVLAGLAAGDGMGGPRRTGEGLSFAGIAARVAAWVDEAGLHQSLRDLADYGTIELRDGGRYVISVPLVERWVRATQPVDQTARLMA